MQSEGKTYVSIFLRKRAESIQSKKTDALPKRDIAKEINEISDKLENTSIRPPSPTRDK